MSQLTDRFIGKLIKTINTAFKDHTVYSEGECLPLEVKAEERRVTGMGMTMGSGTGLIITIGDRRAEIDEYGQLVSITPVDNR